MARYSDHLVLSGTRDEVLAAFRDAAEQLEWSPRADSAEGGLDIDVPADWTLFRPKATIEVRPAMTAGGQWRASLRVKLRWMRPAARAQAVELLSALKATVQGAGAKQLIAGRWSWEQAAIRPLVTTLAAVAIVIAATVDLPRQQPPAASAQGPAAAPERRGAQRQQRANQPVKLPAVALNQPLIYRLEVAVVVFYAGLVVLTPLFFGAARGRLPTEVSARGARFAEEVDESIKETQELADDLDKRMEDAERRITLDRIDIQKLATNANIDLRS